MALVWTEGFEATVIRQNNGTLSGSGKQTANGSFLNTYAGNIAGTPRSGFAAGDSAYGVFLDGADRDDLLIVGTAFLSPTAGFIAERDLIRFESDAFVTKHVTITIGTDNKIRAYRGTSSTGTLLGTASVTSMAGASTYYYVEAKVLLHDTTGSIEVRVDETTVLSLSNVDTKNGGTLTIFDSVEVNTGSTWTRIDDLYICNEQGSTCNDFLGAVHIEFRIPNGNGNSSVGVGSDGNSTDNYLLVDDATSALWANQPTDYVDFASTGDEDTYAFEDSVYPTGNAVKAVMVWVAAEKTDAGSRHAAAVARLSGTEATGVDEPLVNGTYHAFGHPFETKPAGGAWTVSDFNSAEFGVKATA